MAASGRAEEEAALWRWEAVAGTGEQEREVTLDFSFLGEGSFIARILKDGPNSDRVGTDYLFEEQKISMNDKLTLQMVSGGGFVVSVKESQ